MKNNYFLLHSNCICVKGANRSTICDLERKEIYFIPNEIIDVVELLKRQSIAELLEDYDTESQSVIQYYIDFLEKEELGFWTNNPQFFPEISLKWEKPYKIITSIIDIEDSSNLEFSNIFNQLSDLAAFSIELRFYYAPSLEFLSDILLKTNGLRIRNIELILFYNEHLDFENLSSLFYKFGIVSKATIYNSNQDVIKVCERGIRYIYVKQKITPNLHCGNINKDYFSINLETFTESQHHNTCLNRKISIDTDGNIKNCPSMAQSFGNIADTTLEEALAHPDFKKYWNVKKDQISVCQDCEFRHICTDCRAYLENPEDMYSKPLKCGYNPYTCEWEEWSTNPLKQKAIAYYGMEEIL